MDDLLHVYDRDAWRLFYVWLFVRTAGCHVRRVRQYKKPDKDHGDHEAPHGAAPRDED
jgi:hypothetical protein